MIIWPMTVARAILQILLIFGTMVWNLPDSHLFWRRPIFGAFDYLCPKSFGVCFVLTRLALIPQCVLLSELELDVLVALAMGLRLYYTS